MTKIKNIPNSDFESDLTELKYTNHLFLELLYNLSKYPHPQKAKYYVRQGLFAFEENNVFGALKAKK